MSLRKKTFLFVTLIVGIAVLAVVVAARTILIEGYQMLEKNEAKEDVLRAVRSLEERNLDFISYNLKWSKWDATYEFIQDKNQAYIDSNLTDATFMDSRISVIIYVDNEGSVVYEKGHDLITHKEVPVSNDLHSHINRQDLLITHIGRENISGVIELSEGPMLITSFPILKSDGSGPERGTLIVGRYIDSQLLERIEKTTRLKVSYVDLADTPYAGLDKNKYEEVITEVEGRSKLVGYAFINDIYGEPKVAARVELPRNIYAQGNTIIFYLIASVLLIGSIVISGGIFYQEKMVLSPIHRLTSDVNKIRLKGNLAERVTEIGEDEIEQLAKNINAMLTFLAESQGKISRLLTNEKYLRELLMKEHDRLDLIISSMGEGLLAIDNEHKLTMINPVAEKLLEVKARDVIGKKWSDVIVTLKDHSQTPVAERSFAKAIGESKVIITSIDDNHSYKVKSGRVFPVASITAPLERDGVIVGAVKVFKDATAEKESKKIIEDTVTERTRLLWEEKARMFASINSLHMGFIIADKKGKIILKNPAVAEILKIADKSITMPSLAKELSSNLDLISKCQDVLKSKMSYEKDDIYYKDKFLSIFITPIEVGEEKNEVIGYVLLIEDVTPEKQLIRAKDEFFAVASHELRTPLTAIRGNTSLIQEYFADKIKDKDLKEMIDDMHTSSVRLINIVNDFLDASRLEQGRVELKKEEVDVVSVMRGAISELEEFAKQKGLSLKLEEPPPGDYKVLADNARVAQIAVNLLGNSIAYTKAGGATVNFVKNDGVVKVIVADSGIGISPANRRLLFKKFQQAGERVLARDVTKGTGMGLYISKLLTEAMGGKIYLENSELGKGSTFVFELPINK